MEKKYFFSAMIIDENGSNVTLKTFLMLQRFEFQINAVLLNCIHPEKKNALSSQLFHHWNKLHFKIAIIFHSSIAFTAFFCQIKWSCIVHITNKINPCIFSINTRQ